MILQRHPTAGPSNSQADQASWTEDGRRSRAAVTTEADISRAAALRRARAERAAGTAGTAGTAAVLSQPVPLQEPV